jgi:hypothetical protein
MTNGNKQIYNLANDGFTAAEIAEALGYSQDAVMTVLAQGPTRVMAKAARNESKSKQEYLEEHFSNMRDKALAVLETLMVTSEDDSIKLKASMFVLEQQLGLKQPAKAGNTINILQIQRDLQRARELTEGPLDIGSVTVTGSMEMEVAA